MITIPQTGPGALGQSRESTLLIDVIHQTPKFWQVVGRKCEPDLNIRELILVFIQRVVLLDHHVTMIVMTNQTELLSAISCPVDVP
jgi:hypothetical protein